jgi:hypothetical protein
MRRRTLLVTLAVGLFAGAAATALVLGRPPHRVTRKNYERIHNGMTQAEVEALPGGPPGDYRTGRTVSPVPDESGQLCSSEPDNLASEGYWTAFLGSDPQSQVNGVRQRRVH